MSNTMFAAINVLRLSKNVSLFMFLIPMVDYLRACHKSASCDVTNCTGVALSLTGSIA